MADMITFNEILLLTGHILFWQILNKWSELNGFWLIEIWILASHFFHLFLTFIHEMMNLLIKKRNLEIVKAYLSWQPPWDWWGWIMSKYAEFFQCFLQYCKAVECCTFCMYCGHGIGCCVLCTGVLTAICQWCVCVYGSGWGCSCLSWLSGCVMDQRRIEWTGPHDWYADRIWGAARHPHPSQAYPTTPSEYERAKQDGDGV